jgi:hypothetical protein
MKTCVYVRCVHESTFLNAFFEHYIGLGFDMIYVLYNNTQKCDNYVVPTNFTPFVTIKKVFNIGNSLYDHHKSIIDRVKYDWVFITDLDEFLILHNRFLNITALIEEYQAKDSKLNTIQFPWVWSHKFSTEPETVQDILKTRKKFIGRLGVGKEVWYKMMVKTSHINMICIHSTKLKGVKTQVIGYNGKIENIDIHNQPDDKQLWTLWGDEHGFRKHDIDEGIYSDVFLLHVTTRNMVDVYAKTMEKQARREKKQYDKEVVSKILKKLESIEVNEEILKEFIKAFGYRVEFPLKTTQFGDMEHEAIIQSFRIPVSTLPIYSKIIVPKGISPIVFSKIGKVLDQYFILNN